MASDLFTWAYLLRKKNCGREAQKFKRGIPGMDTELGDLVKWIGGQRPFVQNVMNQVQSVMKDRSDSHKL